MKMAVNYHEPVLTKAVLEALAVGSGGFFVDGTLGCGGHAEAILKKSSPDGKVLGIDRDQSAIEISRERLKEYADRLMLRCDVFSRLPYLWEEMGRPRWDGILLDLGISSTQLDDVERGLSFMTSARLDMRMDISQESSAWDVVNNCKESDLASLIREYGEERWAPHIARRICEERKKSPIETTKELANIVMRSVPKKFWSKKIHPATKTFQAIRIAVNNELNHLNTFLENLPKSLPIGGRAAIISFHSLEDRIVKNCFRKWAGEGIGRLITKKPITADIDEVKKNPRSRSAKLRAMERIK